MTYLLDGTVMQKRYLATKEDVEHGCCHEAALLDLSIEGERYRQRIAEFWSYNDARRIEQILNDQEAMKGS